MWETIQSGYRLMRQRLREEKLRASSRGTLETRSTNKLRSHATQQTEAGEACFDSNVFARMNFLKERKALIRRLLKSLL